MAETEPRGHHEAPKKKPRRKTLRSLEDLRKWVDEGLDRPETEEEREERERREMGPKRSPLPKEEFPETKRRKGGKAEKNDEAPERERSTESEAAAEEVAEEESAPERARTAEPELEEEEGLLGEAVRKAKEMFGEEETPIDMTDRRTIIAKLNGIRILHFDRPLSRLSPKDINPEEKRNAQIFLDSLAERMRYEAIVQNWSEEMLEDKYQQMVEIQRDKAGGGSLSMEAWRKIKRGWNAAAGAAGEALGGDKPGMEGLNPGIQARIDRGSQLIRPDEINENIEDLGFEKITQEVFKKPLDKADDDEIDGDRREFIEDAILPLLPFQAVAQVVVENYPVGNGVPTNQLLNGTVVFERKWWPDTTIPYKIQQRELALTYALRIYIKELLGLRNTCFVGKKRIEMIAKQGEDEENFYKKYLVEQLKKWQKIL